MNERLVIDYCATRYLVKGHVSGAYCILQSADICSLRFLQNGPDWASIQQFVTAGDSSQNPSISSNFIVSCDYSHFLTQSLTFSVDFISNNFSFVFIPQIIFLQQLHSISTKSFFLSLIFNLHLSS